MEKISLGRLPGRVGSGGGAVVKADPGPLGVGAGEWAEECYQSSCRLLRQY